MTRFSIVIAVVLSAIFLYATVGYGQVTCESFHPDSLKRFDSYSQKQFNKLKKKKDLNPETAFQIATYLRLKGDSTYKEWYSLMLDLGKSWYRDLRHDKQASRYLLFHIGLSYYFLDDYQKANNYFQKAIKAQCPDKCLNYYDSLTETKTYFDNINWQAIIKDSNLTTTQTLAQLDPILLDKFPAWKTMADPGKPFNPTDNGGEPHRRLYFAAKFKDYWIVSYEHGGRGYHTHCFFIKIKPYKTLLVFEQDIRPGTKIETFKTIEDLKVFTLNPNQPIVLWDWYDY